MEPAEEAKRIIESMKYCPITGQLFWRKDRPKDHFTRSNDYVRYMRKNAGTLVKSCLNSNGYLHIRFGYKIYGVHRLAFVVMQGTFPKEHVDHINGDRTDNTWDNLREVPRVLNSRNRQKPSNNSSGVTGVSWHKTKQKWIARVSFNGKEKQIGAFTLFDDAVNARVHFFSLNAHLGYTTDHGIR